MKVVLCRRCLQPPKNGRLPRGLCGPCVVETIKNDTHEMWAEGSAIPTLTGNRRMNDSRYIEVETERGWELEHRWVMQNHLGRPLVTSENVHHINGDRADNRVENLELWWTVQPGGQRVRDLIRYMAKHHAAEVAAIAAEAS